MFKVPNWHLERDRGRDPPDSRPEKEALPCGNGKIPDARNRQRRRGGNAGHDRVRYEPGRGTGVPGRCPPPPFAISHHGDINLRWDGTGRRGLREHRSYEGVNDPGEETVSPGLRLFLPCGGQGGRTIKTIWHTAWDRDVPSAGGPGPADGGQSHRTVRSQYIH